MKLKLLTLFAMVLSMQVAFAQRALTGKVSDA
jgi:hypothetical protein